MRVYQKMISILILICLISCGTEAEPTNVYIQGKYDWSWYHVNFPVPVTTDIIFGKTSEPDAAGTCYKSSRGSYIAIDQEYWDKVGHRRRTQLIWHELGHCQLDMEHNNSNVPSVMRSYAWQAWEFFWWDGMTDFTKQMLKSREDMYD